MSEYIDIESEATTDPEVMIFHTNMILVEGEDEHYVSPEAMAEGSAVAQALAYVDGLESVEFQRHMLRVRRAAATPWHLITADITIALKEFFL